MKEATKKRTNALSRLLPIVVLPVTILGIVLFVWVIASPPTNSGSSSSIGPTSIADGSGGSPLTTIDPPPTCGYCAENLVGANSERVGQFALAVARRELDPLGTTEVVLVRAIKWEEAPELGIGCLPDFSAIEDPPLALVVLRGNMDLGRALSGWSALPQDKRRVKYIVMVLDLWSAGWVHLTGSPNGGHFRTLLNDPSLPQEGSTAPMKCPPRAPRTLHYGQSAGGRLIPTYSPAPTPIALPTSEFTPVIPSIVIPSALPTQLPPTPVRTAIP